MKKFIKAVVVASVLVSASSAFATISKAGVSGTSVSCPHKLNAGLFDATADKQVAAAGANTNIKVIGGTVVK